MTSIGAVSGFHQPPPVSAAPPKPQVDNDGDNDNNRPEPSGASAGGSTGRSVDIKA